MSKLLCKHGPAAHPGSPSYSADVTRKDPLLLLAVFAMLVAVSNFVTAKPAAASVCGVSATGAEDQTGGGSTAPPDSFANVACGNKNTVGIGRGVAFGYNNKAG